MVVGTVPSKLHSGVSLTLIPRADASLEVLPAPILGADHVFRLLLNRMGGKRGLSASKTLASCWLSCGTTRSGRALSSRVTGERLAFFFFYFSFSFLFYKKGKMIIIIREGLMNDF